MPAKPEPIHAPGVSPAFGVVGGQPDMAFFGGIQRRDLPGQIVIPGPALSLCMLIVTPT